MSTIIVDTLTGKSTATTITIGSTPVVSASANSLTIRGEGSNQTSVQQGLAKFWGYKVSDGSSLADSLNLGSITDTSTGIFSLNFTNNMGNATYVFDCFTGIEAYNLTINVRDNTNLTDITALVSGHGDLA
jgi:hypothetical protein